MLIWELGFSQELHWKATNTGLPFLFITSFLFASYICILCACFYSRISEGNSSDFSIFKCRKWWQIQIKLYVIERVLLQPTHIQIYKKNSWTTLPANYKLSPMAFFSQCIKVDLIIFCIYILYIRVMLHAARLSTNIKSFCPHVKNRIYKYWRMDIRGQKVYLHYSAEELSFRLKNAFSVHFNLQM